MDGFDSLINFIRNVVCGRTRELIVSVCSTMHRSEVVLLFLVRTLLRPLEQICSLKNKLNPLKNLVKDWMDSERELFELQ